MDRITSSQLVGHARHEAREPGATDKSHIDPGRTHLNRLVLGNEPDPRKAVASHLELHGARIQKANGRPFTRLLLSASPEFFRPDDPDAAGTWEPSRLEAWTQKSTEWLKAEFGDDCVHASLHLDESTPHLHALIVPIPEKGQARRQRRAPRTKQRPGETAEAFEARREKNAARRSAKAAGAAPAAPWVSHHGHPAFQGRRSYAALLDRYAAAVEPLGIERGERGSGARRKDTREWADDEWREAVQARQEAVSSAQKAKATERGVKALSMEVIAYRPPTSPEAKGSLSWGPRAPESPEKRNRIVAAVKPAHDEVLRIARGLWEAAEKARQKVISSFAFERMALDSERAALEREKAALNEERRHAAPALARAQTEAERQGQAAKAAELAALSRSLRRQPQRERDER